MQLFHAQYNSKNAFTKTRYVYIKYTFILRAYFNTTTRQKLSNKN